MARLGLDVVPVLCIHGSAVPWKTVQGVRLVGPRGLEKLIAKAKPVLSEEDVGVLAEMAGRGLAGTARRVSAQTTPRTDLAPSNCPLIFL